MLHQRKNPVLTMPYGVPQVELEPSRATGLSQSIGCELEKVNWN